MVLALSLALYAVVQFGGIGSNVGKLGYFAGTSTRTLQIQDFIEQMRRSALRYLYDHDETMRTEYEGIAVQMVATVDKAEQLSISEERKKEYRDIKAQFAVTQQKAKSLFDTIRQMGLEQAELFKVGDDLSASAKVLIDKIATGTDESQVTMGEKLRFTLALGAGRQLADPGHLRSEGLGNFYRRGRQGKRDARED